MSVLAKAIAVVVTAGTLSTGGYFLINNLKSPKTIGESLVSKGFRLLDFSDPQNTDNSKDYADWSKKVTSYKEQTATDKFSDVLLNSEISENIKALKEKCREVLKVSLSDQNLGTQETQAEKWCAVKNS